MRADFYPDEGPMEDLRTPPYNLEAEQSVLGAMLIDREATPTIAGILQVNNFYRQNHRHIYEAMLELYAKNEPIDLVTTSDALTRRGLLEQVGDVDYLALLASVVPSSALAAQYAQIVQSKAILRDLISASQQITASCYQQEDVASVLEDAERLIFRLSQSRMQRDFRGMPEIISEVYERIAELVKNKGGVSGLETGFIDLDRLTSGLQPSDLVILAARPSVGKTAFALNIARHVALEQKTAVAFFSLEMAADQLAMRMLCTEAKVDSQKLRNGWLDASDWAKISEASDVLAEAPLFIDDSPALTSLELRSKARRLKLDRNVGLVIVDYLQLMRGRGRVENRQQEVAEITRSLKAVARELQVPVLALAQLSRRAEEREGRRPSLTDLRESGEIEQAADLVAFLYREDYHDRETANRNVVEVIIGKHRNGPVGTVKLTNLRHIGLFSNRAPEPEEGGF